MLDEMEPCRDREATRAAAAEMKLRRQREATQAFKDYEANKVAIRAKTERLRAARLAIAMVHKIRTP